jgi:GNAT superfamily N-acetyltransferase
MTSEPWAVSPAGPEHSAALEQLFAATCFGCYCRFWHFDGHARQWLMRCANTPELNAVEMRSALAEQRDDARGLVAHAPDGMLAGWLKLAPAPAVPKLYEQRLYKGLEIFSGDRSGVYAIACVLVHEAFRRRGVARALISAAVAHARALGAHSLEAFPRTDSDVADAALMMGPLAVYRELGFATLRDTPPYPVLRKDLRGGA